MATPKNKDNLLTCLKNVVRSGVGTFVVFLAVYLFLAAAMEYNSFSERSVAAFVLMGIAYPCFLYVLHMRGHLYTYAEHADHFDAKAELLAYIRGEGRYFVWIYGACALAAEIDMLIPRETVGRPVALVCSFATNPIWYDIPIPVLRSVLAFAYSVAVTCLLAVLRSRKVYREDLRGAKEKDEK